MVSLLSNNYGPKESELRSRRTPYFETLVLKTGSFNFLKGRGDKSSCHLLPYTRLDLLCVQMFNNSSSSGTSWSPQPIKVFFLSNHCQFGANRRASTNAP